VIALVALAIIVTAVVISTRRPVAMSDRPGMNDGGGAAALPAAPAAHTVDPEGSDGPRRATTPPSERG
jgi:hypothetical protein